MFEKTRCRYILPFACDNYLEKQAVDTLLKTYKKYPDTPCVRASCREVNEQGDQIKIYQVPSGSILRTRYILQPWCFNHELYDEVEPIKTYAKFLHIGDEIDVLVKLERLGEFKVINSILYNKRIHSNSFLQENKKKAKDIIDFYLSKGG